MMDQPSFRIWEHSTVAMGEILKTAHGEKRNYWGADPQDLLKRIDRLKDRWGFDIATGKPVMVRDAVEPGDAAFYALGVDQRGMITVLPVVDGQRPSYTLIGAPLAYGARLMREQPGFVINAEHDDNYIALSGIVSRIVRKTTWYDHLPLWEVYSEANAFVKAMQKNSDA